MMKFCRTLVWLSVLTVAAVLFTGCSQSPEPEKSIEADSALRVLRRGNGGEPESLDPSIAEDVHSFNILADLYEGLVVESADGTLVPGVAVRWDVSPDGRQYTFHLRDDAVWSNGDTVTANEFVAAFHRVISPATVSAYSFLLEPILNYRAVLNGDMPPESLGVRALDERTLLVELQSPTEYFLDILAMPITYPVHALHIDNPDRFRNPEIFIGNGPYVLDSWLIRFKIRLRKNDKYRNAPSVGIDIVDYFPISEPTTEFNMYRAGELDITATVPPAVISNLRESKNNELKIAPGLGLYYLAFDLTESPFDDVALRQSLTMAIDREILVSIIGRGEQAAFGIVPPGVSNHHGAQFPWYGEPASEREKAARETYAKAGYDESRPLQVKLTYDAGDIHETVALTVASMWRDVLGVEVQLEKMEWKLFLATRDDRAGWQAMRFSWSGDYNDASTFLDIFRTDSEQNLSRYASDSYDTLLDSAKEQIDPRSRATTLNAAEALVLEDYPISPLYFYVSKHMVSDRVGNYQDNILDRHPTQYLQLSPAD